MKATRTDRRSVTMQELPAFLALGWAVLSYGTWTGNAFLVVIGRA